MDDETSHDDSIGRLLTERGTLSPNLNQLLGGRPHNMLRILVIPAHNVALPAPNCCRIAPEQALVSLLGSLSSSVIPESACTAVSEAAEGIDAEESASTLMGGMPTLHREVFEYLGRCAN